MLHFVGSQGLSVCWETVGRLQDSARGRGPHANGSRTRDELFIAGQLGVNIAITVSRDMPEENLKI